MKQPPSALGQFDPDIFDAIANETIRQGEKLELIASENFVSEAVLEALGSVMTNKYAEGYPGKRYYGGCEFVDVAENLARDRAKQLFGCEHVNVQPHSGSNANMAVYCAALKPGDQVMGLDLSHGGHLTHGHPINFSGIFYKFSGYQVDRETELIDYDALAAQARELKPKMIVCGASAYSRIWDFARIREICDEVGAIMFADIAHIAGLVATGLHPSPVPHADFVTTTTHKTLRGPRGGMIMCREKYAADIDRIVMPGIQGGPLMHVIAAKAVAFKEALQPSFKIYQQQVIANARRLAAELQGKGERVVSGGTDNHLFLLSFIGRGFSGKKAEVALDKAGMTANKNTVPFDPEKPFVTSGVRIGTPAITTRGMKEIDMVQVGSYISRAIEARGDDAVLAKIADEVAEFGEQFPLYQQRREAAGR